MMTARNPRPVSVNPVADPGIPCRGALGLWTPPADIVTRLQALATYTPSGMDEFAADTTRNPHPESDR